MVTQPGLHDQDLVLWTQLLGEVFNVEVLERLGAEHPDVRYAHGFLIQQLVEGPRPVGEIAENLGVTSQAVSKGRRWWRAARCRPCARGASARPSSDHWGSDPRAAQAARGTRR
jgi:hypothetical protein